MASTWPRSIRPGCAGRSGWCCRRIFCLAVPCVTTLRWRNLGWPWNALSRPPSSPERTISSWSYPKATIPWWASTAVPSQVASVSAWRLRVRWSATHVSSSSTKPPALSTTSPKPLFSATWPTCVRDARCSSLPIVYRPCARPTASWYSTRDALLSMGHTRNSWSARAITPGYTHTRTAIRTAISTLQCKGERHYTMLSRRQQRTTPAKGPAWEFLPAVLEIEEAPPSPVGRMVTWTILIVFTAALLWAAFGTIDIVATAQGKIISSGHSKVVQPLESGVINAIHVQNGQEVQAGQVLIELDTTVNNADHDRLVNELQAARLDVVRLRALLAGKDTMPAPPGTDPTHLAVQRQLLRDQLDEYRTRLEGAKWAIEQRQEALAGTNANIDRLKEIIPLSEERAISYQQLWKKTYVAKLQYLDAERDRIERVQELVVQEHKRVQDSAALAEAQKQLQTMSAEFKRTRQTELVGAETKVASLIQEVTKAHSRTQFQRLTAPIDGVVQQLAVHTLGGVVTPAQSLLVIVPKAEPLEVEAWLENKDIGFVRVGQQAEIKVAAFPFTRYGTIPALVRTLSHDAVAPEKDGTMPARTLSPDGGQPERSSLVYAARVSLERTAIQVEGTPVALSPGMAVTVEIKTGTRRLLEYFLSPVLQTGQESVRER